MGEEVAGMKPVRRASLAGFSGKTRLFFLSLDRRIAEVPTLHAFHCRYVLPFARFDRTQLGTEIFLRRG